MKTFIVTGSCGLVGQEITQFLLKKNYKVIGIDNNLRKFFFGKDASTNKIKNLLKENKNYLHINIDIRDKIKLETIIKKYSNFISIIHCAAQPSHDWAKKNPFLDFNVNANATLYLLELLNRYNKKASFVYLSTNKVYGDKINYVKFIEKKTRFVPVVTKFSKYGVNEEMSIDQSKHSLFGVSKLSADLMVQEFGRYYNLNTVCFRCGCISGPMHSGAKLHGFLSYLVKSYLQNNTYEIIGYKGKQVRDNIHSYDLCNAIWEFIKKPKIAAVYNIGGGTFSNCSILEAISILEKMGGKKFKYTLSNNIRSGDHKWWISNLSKFKKDYPRWNMKFNTKLIIEDIYNYLKNNE